MAISPVGGTVTAAAVGATALTVSYNPTAGNVIAAFVGTNGTVTALTVKDSGAHALTAGTLVANGTNQYVFPFFYTASSGVTSFVASWATSRNCSFALEEYSGVTGGVNGGLAGNTATGSSSAPTITVTTQDNNDYVVAGMANTNAITTTTGTMRQQAANGNAGKVNLSDNTVATAGSVTIAGTILAAGIWSIALLELRLSAATIAAQNYNQLMMVGCGT
jgi:hypothetical protein